MADAGGGRVKARVARAAPKRKKRAVRWSKRRQATFLEALAELANVARAARVAGVSSTHIYRLRRQSAEFREAWRAALEEGLARLEMALLERATNGVVKPIYYGGKPVGETREFSDRTGLALLAAHRGTGGGAGRARQAEARETADELRARVDEKLAAMHARLLEEE